MSNEFGSENGNHSSEESFQNTSSEVIEEAKNAVLNTLREEGEQPGVEDMLTAGHIERIHTDLYSELGKSSFDKLREEMEEKYPGFGEIDDVSFEIVAVRGKGDSLYDETPKEEREIIKEYLDRGAEIWKKKIDSKIRSLGSEKIGVRAREITSFLIERGSTASAYAISGRYLSKVATREIAMLGLQELEMLMDTEGNVEVAKQVISKAKYKEAERTEGQKRKALEFLLTDVENKEKHFRFISFAAATDPQFFLGIGILKGAEQWRELAAENVKNGFKTSREKAASLAVVYEELGIISFDDLDPAIYKLL